MDTKYKYDNLIVSADTYDAIYYIVITPERAIIFDLKQLDLTNRWFTQEQVKSSDTNEKRNKELANLTWFEKVTEFTDFTGYTFNPELIVNKKGTN